MTQPSLMSEREGAARPPFTVQRLQHVSVPRPKDSHEAARRFYGEVLGLEEIQPPASLVELDLIWYRLGDQELHLFVSDDGPARAAQHLCLVVDDLAALRARLETADAGVYDDIAIPNRPRFFCRDPFGNLIECTTILGAYQ